MGYFQPQNKVYSVFFDANTKVQELKAEFASGFGVAEIRSYPKAILRASESIKINLPPRNYKLLAFRKIEALDEYAALTSALSRLNWIHDIYGLFRHRNSFEIANEAVVYQVESKSVHVLRTDANHMHRIHDNRREKANAKLGEMLDDLRLPMHKDGTRFFRVINFHGLAVRSASEENQLINLWTSMETITSSHSSNSSIVDTVTREAIPIICLNYFYRLLRAVTFDLVRYNRKKLGEVLDRCATPDDADLVEKVLALICAKENDDVKEQFLASITDFELLRYRIFSMNKFLVSGKKLTERIERHERLVSWQLHRVYRARNQIVHSSSTGNNTESLIVNMHDYFDQVFEISAKLCSGISGFNTYDEAFKYANVKYVDYKRRIKEIDRTSASDVTSILWRP